MKFAFLICTTPEKCQTPLRKDLFETARKALNAQTSGNWIAYLLGERAGIEGRFQYVKTRGVDKNEKLAEAVQLLEALPEKPDFLIRLDDDDLISPTILESIMKSGNFDFDCYCDFHHTYIDLVHLRISSKPNVWMANTVVHAYRHAVQLTGAGSTPLIAHDHSLSWHKYYAGKKVIYSLRRKPIYYRILSPTSITSGEAAGGGTVNWDRFHVYLKGYGPWQPLTGVFPFHSELQKISRQYFSDVDRIGTLERLKEFVKVLFHRLVNSITSISRNR